MGGPEAEWPEELLNAPVRFWVCPVVEHRRRRSESGGPVLTVEWRDGIAYCTAPDCDKTSRPDPAVA